MNVPRGRLLLLGTAVLLIIVVSFWRQAGDGGGGCSRATAQAQTCDGGLDLFAALLQVEGNQVRRASSRLSDRDLADADTLVVVDPVARRAADAAVIRRYLDRGGRVVAGPGQALQVAGAPPSGPTRSAGGGTSFLPLVPISEVASVDRVQTAGRGAWTKVGAFLPGLGSKQGALLLAGRVGAGRLLLLADLSALDNDHIAKDANAALAVSLVGDKPGSVLVLESPAAFSAPTGLAAIPIRWRWTLVGLLASALVAMLAVGRRLGPPEYPDRELPPARVAHATAIGGLLSRTGQPAVVGATLQRRAQRLLGGPIRGTPWTSEETVTEAVRRGLSEADSRALVDIITGPDDLVRAGRALAHLEERRRSA